MAPVAELVEVEPVWDAPVAETEPVVVALVPVSVAVAPFPVDVAAASPVAGKKWEL